jgi:hypothetical protein
MIDLQGLNNHGGDEPDFFTSAWPEKWGGPHTAEQGLHVPVDKLTPPLHHFPKADVRRACGYSKSLKLMGFISYPRNGLGQQ